MDEPEVMSLIDYCQDLEGELLEKKRSEKYSKEEVLLTLVREIYSSCKSIECENEESKRFKESSPVDFEKAVINLKKYIEEFSKDNFISL